MEGQIYHFAPPPTTGSKWNPRGHKKKKEKKEKKKGRLGEGLGKSRSRCRDFI